MALTPALALARAGGGGSFGSRGMRTYSAPAPTRTAPYAAPMQRSMTPRSNPGAGYGAPGSAPGGFGARSGFASGFLGGLIGAGIGGLLLGRGLFGGIGGAGGFLGLLLQIAIIVLVVRWLLRMFANRREAAFAGPGGYARQGAPDMAVPGSGGGPGGVPGGGPPVTITRADFQQFEQILQRVQGAWTAQDMRSLQALCTPEMVSYFGDELSEQASRGVHNSVSDVRLEQGDLSESWSEGSREYATVAMRFSMLDVTRDNGGRVVEGSDTVRTLATEFWTFVRAPGGRWLLSAIQQSGPPTGLSPRLG
ncbi:MAG TPA: TIM44-like domain-containing protein [Acetobacteraceae bacterium]|nr:TIM44-like domain-containing protein [Acetobacteraceae bacterium]